MANFPTLKAYLTWETTMFAALRSFAMPAAAAAALLILPMSAAQADGFRVVADRGEFVQLVTGRTLRYPGVTLQVTPNGDIAGKGLGIPVTGAWSWQSGYFCRDLYWGQRDLGPNCQLVQANGSKLRFTSDQGSGQSAEFRLR